MEVMNIQNQRLKSNCFTSWRKSSQINTEELQKYADFYKQNLKIKAFFTLLRYKKKKKQLRTKLEEDKEKEENFIKGRFFTLWRRAYTHKMNQLENRKCFKVKFSDYCK